MLRLTARYADAWNTAWFGLPDDLLQRRLAELNAALEAEGRDAATLRRTVGMEVWDPATTGPGQDPGGAVDGSVDELARAIDAHEQLGFDDLIVQLAPKTPRSLDRLEYRVGDVGDQVTADLDAVDLGQVRADVAG